MKHDLYHLLPIDSKALPPPPAPTDTHYPQGDPQPFSHLDPIRLGLSLGFAAAILFLVISLISSLLGGAILVLFEVFFPGLDLTAFSGIVIGSLLSFLAGAVFGLLLGVLYNALDNQRTQGVEFYG